jgi:hypothetical protein
MARIITAQVETLLRKNEPVNDTQSPPAAAASNATGDRKPMPNGLSATYGTSGFSPSSRHCMSDNPQTEAYPAAGEMSSDEKLDGLLDENSPWQIVELGLEEPLPLQEIIEDL